MSLEHEVKLLRNIPLFQNIEASKLKLLAFTSERLNFGADDVLFRQGEMGDAAYIVIEGEADVVIENKDNGTEAVVATLGANSILGEIAILCDVPRTATVRAKTELTALKVSKDVFFRLVLDFPQMAVEIMRELAARLERMNQMLNEERAKASPK